MNVHGIEISQQIIDAAVERMKQGSFKANDIEKVVFPLLPDTMSWKVPKVSVSMRTADRLIQKLRKNGTIGFVSGKKTIWEWKG